MKNLAKLLGHYRLLERKTVRELAAEIGIGPSTLSRIEHNELMDGATLALVLTWIMSSPIPPPEPPKPRIHLPK
jgi:transcriptional regulator with XRE-family HTH domain